MASQYTHFGTQVSLFSGKTRAYLNYKNIPFKEVLPSSATIKNELYPATGVRVIPVVKTPDGEYLQDTTHIIDSLEAHFPETSVYPTNPLQKFLALLLELYGDEWLTVGLFLLFFHLIELKRNMLLLSTNIERRTF